MTRKNVVATADHGSLTSDKYKDETTLAGPFVELSAAYTMLDKTPLTFRLGGGVARTKATFKNGGLFSGDIQHACDNEPKACDPDESVSVSAQLAVAEKAPTFIVPFAAPEVRIGYRVTKKIVVDFGLTFFVMLPPQTTRQPTGGGGGFTLRSDQGRRANIGLVEGFATVPTEQNGGLATLPNEDGFGVIMAIVPSFAGHFDF
jgi:hypothetical protein